MPDETAYYSFDEYKLYYESTEKVSERRIANNTWNYSICIAIIIAVAVLANWSVSEPEFGLITIVAVLMLAGMGTLLCTLWIGQLRDSKALNTAKFHVLNDIMAPKVQFAPKDERKSANPFDIEWKKVKELDQASKVYSMEIVALRSSNAEFLVPKAFRWLFIFIIVVTLAVTVVNFSLLVHGAFHLKQAANFI
jgi:hypothetical protein